LSAKKVIYLQNKVKLNSGRNNGYKIMAQWLNIFWGFKKGVFIKD